MNLDLVVAQTNLHYRWVAARVISGILWNTGVAVTTRFIGDVAGHGVGPALDSLNRRLAVLARATSVAKHRILHEVDAAVSVFRARGHAVHRVGGLIVAERVEWPGGGAT